MSLSTKKLIEHDIALISAKQLTCIREDRILFEQLDLSVYAGDIVQVEGPNGAGKTSLLRILSGLSIPYDGEVYFNNENHQQPINQNSELFHQQLLYLGHLPGVKGSMTAEENLTFNLTLHGEINNSSNKVSDHIVENSLADVNLLGFEDSLASHLSAGQHRRIALARLLTSNAKIWILDEPFTAIDKQGIKKLERLFINHTEQGGCVILTTHQDLTITSARFRKLSLAYRI